MSKDANRINIGVNAGVSYEPYSEKHGSIYGNVTAVYVASIVEFATHLEDSNGSYEFVIGE